MDESLLGAADLAPEICGEARFEVALTHCGTSISTHLAGVMKGRVELLPALRSLGHASAVPRSAAVAT